VIADFGNAIGTTGVVFAGHTDIETGVSHGISDIAAVGSDHNRVGARALGPFANPHDHGFAPQIEQGLIRQSA
jgi:hypothetical protein